MSPIWMMILILALFNDDMKGKAEDEMRAIANSKFNEYEPENEHVRFDAKTGIKLKGHEDKQNSSRIFKNASLVGMNFSMSHLKQLINEKRGNLAVLSSQNGNKL